jgi:hypothetical protein
VLGKFQSECWKCSGYLRSGLPQGPKFRVNEVLNDTTITVHLITTQNRREFFAGTEDRQNPTPFPCFWGPIDDFAMTHAAQTITNHIKATWQYFQFQHFSGLAFPFS